MAAEQFVSLCLVPAAGTAVLRRTWQGASFGNLKPAPQKWHTLTPYSVCVCVCVYCVYTSSQYLDIASRDHHNSHLWPKGRHCSFPISWVGNKPQSSWVNRLALWVPRVFTQCAAGLQSTFVALVYVSPIVTYMTVKVQLMESQVIGTGMSPAWCVPPRHGQKARRLSSVPLTTGWPASVLCVMRGPWGPATHCLPAACSLD